MTKHTQGLWEIGGAAHIFVAGENGANICSMSEPRASTLVGYTAPDIGSEAWPEIQANARLIAAAPDMLAALEECVDQIADDTISAAKLARAAIAKATGVNT